MIQSLIARYPLVSDQVDKNQISVILDELQKVVLSDTTGAIVEFGCYIGTTSLFIRRFLDEHNLSEKVAFHVYDSFEGLPEKTPADRSGAGEQFRAGELAVSKKAFYREFQKAHLKPPVVHKGWFRDLTARDVPEKIVFAFLDGDFYESIRDSLHLVLPRMQKGGVIVVDDYAREALPGAARAVHEHFRPDQIRVAHNLGVIHL